MLKTPPKAWKTLFNQQKQVLEEIFEKLEVEEEKYGEYVPLKKDIFKAYKLTSPKNIKVCVVGLDPYYSISKYTGKPRATGLAFSVDKKDIIPPSLRNIFKELERTISDFEKPDNGDLTKWAKEGVFLLNSALTARIGVSGRHLSIWRPFIKATLEYVHEINPDCIYCLWGSTAMKFRSVIENDNEDRILTGPHPSISSFIGCNHFAIIDEIMEDDGEDLIDWNLD